MSHLGARVFAVLKEGRPYELRDTEGNPISKELARKLILDRYQVPEEVRRERRRRNSKVSKNRETATYRTNEAAKAPQYQSQPSPENEFNPQPQGGQVNDL